MVPPRRTPLEIQEELRLHVERATEELNRARAQRDRLSAIGADAADTPDGAFAMRESLRLHGEALQRLKTALRAFDAFNRRKL